ncbi:MAG TPA: ABC transporter ATP-binding protein [Tepidisphaeraceae bacterium]|nr:ABC transporter ATP-binding protein [Tepidisphaeraceae bacterium]
MPLTSADTPSAPAATTSAARAARIALRGVSRVFDGGVEAVGSVDLDIGAGEFVALLGPSGSGKSTLLRIIAALDRATAGDVAVATPAGQRPRVAFVFQDAHLLPWRDVLRNVALPLELQRVPKPERLDRASDAIEQVGLSDAIGRYPAQLSGGMRMRASLARALVNEPELLLLDEPFAALDEITRHQLDDQLRELWSRRRMTVLFVTHSINEAAFLADRAVVFTRRPARVMLDHVLDLPAERRAELRTEPRFAREMRVLFDALRAGQEAR